MQEALRGHCLLQNLLVWLLSSTMVGATWTNHERVETGSALRRHAGICRVPYSTLGEVALGAAAPPRPAVLDSACFQHHSPLARAGPWTIGQDKTRQQCRPRGYGPLHLTDHVGCWDGDWGSRLPWRAGMVGIGTRWKPMAGPDPTCRCYPPSSDPGTLEGEGQRKGVWLDWSSLAQPAWPALWGLVVVGLGLAGGTRYRASFFNMAMVD